MRGEESLIVQSGEGVLLAACACVCLLVSRFSRTVPSCWVGFLKPAHHIQMPLDLVRHRLPEALLHNVSIWFLLQGSKKLGLLCFLQHWRAHEPLQRFFVGVPAPHWNGYSWPRAGEIWRRPQQSGLVAAKLQRIAGR